tara:strand:- start:578 stop:961 length:384 start_codon:yes stop_codon:yes gene_type:complete
MNTASWTKQQRKKKRVAILEDSHTYAHLLSASMLVMQLDPHVVYSLAEFKGLQGDWNYATLDLEVTDSTAEQTAEWVLGNLNPANCLIVSGSADTLAVTNLIKAGFDFVDKRDAPKVLDRMGRWFKV